MSTPVNRESLTKTLEQRYQTQHVGGAYDAKKPTPDIFGIQEKLWTKPGFQNGGNGELGLGGQKKFDQSVYLKGFDNTKYK